MSEGANVRSIDALKDFKVALCNFADDAKNALSSVDMEVRRTRGWLSRDQLGYWQTQVKRCHEQLTQAKTDLFRRRLSQSEAISDSDQKEAVRVATKKLREAEQKVDQIKKWVPVLDHAIAKYQSQAHPLGDRLEGDLVRSVALLDRMVIALEAYAALAPPSSPGGPTVASGSNATATSSAAPRVGQASSEPDGAPGTETSADPADGPSTVEGVPALTPAAASTDDELAPIEPDRGTPT